MNIDKKLGVDSNKNKFQIASFGASGGVTYLANVLLELGFHAYAAHIGPWFDREKHQITSDAIRLRQAIALPYLQKRPPTAPSREIDIAWSHQWPSPSFNIFPTIILYRDPRQTLFSEWRKLSKVWFRGSFSDFLSDPNYYLGMSRVDEWLLWQILWRAIEGPPKYFIKFELSKTQPLDEFNRLLSWIGANATEQEIMEAVIKSSFDTVKSSDPNNDILTAGKLDDYKTQTHPEDLVAIEKHCVALYENEKIPEYAKNIISSANLLQERFGRWSSSEYEPLLFGGNIYDLKTALRASRIKTYSDILLAEAIHKTENIMTSSVFGNYINHIDPNVKIVLASVLFVFSQSEYPGLISAQSIFERLNQKRKRFTRRINQRVRNFF